jgi:acyl-CoA reductase-like NAD-dependent aldehyde dehydrogenase
MSSMTASTAATSGAPRLPDGSCGLLIDGSFVDAPGGATMPNSTPATAEMLAHVAVAGAEDVERAVRGANLIERHADTSRPWSKAWTTR